jgi:hypothetical protein
VPSISGVATNFNTTAAKNNLKGPCYLMFLYVLKSSQNGVTFDSKAFLSDDNEFETRSW